MQRLTTVITPASGYDLATLSDVKSEIGLTSTDFDTVLAKYITTESVRISDYCRCVFAQETVKDTFRLTDGQRGTVILPLSRFPVSSVISVYTDDDLLDPSRYETDRSSLFYLDDDGDEYLPWCFSKIAVTYVCGYASIPTPVAQACCALVKARYYAKDRDPALQYSQIEGVGSMRFSSIGASAGPIPDDILSILNPYRKASPL